MPQVKGVFHNLPYFSVYGIIFSIFLSIILFVEGREPLKKVR